LGRHTHTQRERERERTYDNIIECTTERDYIAHLSAHNKECSIEFSSSAIGQYEREQTKVLTSEREAFGSLGELLGAKERSDDGSGGADGREFDEIEEGVGALAAARRRGPREDA